jgi:hypothetical protein
MIKTSTPHGLLELSNALVAVKNSISDETIFPTERKVDVMILLSVGAQYIAKEINVMKRIDSKEALMALLNAVYIEGFLFRNNLAYFQNQINSATDVATAASVLSKVVGIASKTIEKGLSPALEQWKTVEPKMENFLDNVIKSSTLSAAATVDAKIKR